jgi:hypothetical protein
MALLLGKLVPALWYKGFGIIEVTTGTTDLTIIVPIIVLTTAFTGPTTIVPIIIIVPTTAITGPIIIVRIFTATIAAGNNHLRPAIVAPLQRGYDFTPVL